MPEPAVAVSVSTSTETATPGEPRETAAPAPETRSSNTSEGVAGPLVDLAQQVTRLQSEVESLTARLAERPDAATKAELAAALERLSALESPEIEEAEVIEVEPEAKPAGEAPAGTPLAHPLPPAAEVKKKGFFPLF